MTIGPIQHIESANIECWCSACEANCAERTTPMRPDDKRQTCYCGHRYGVHATGGTACLAVVDDWDRGGEPMKTYQCSCHGWNPERIAPSSKKVAP